MNFEKTGFEKIQVDLNRLDEVMADNGLLRSEHWDYERVTYDKKFELKDGVYYLRVFGFALEGDVGAHRALIQLKTPVLGKHYYPHGVEYGEDEHFPLSLQRQCETILAAVKAELETFVIIED